MRQEKCSRFGGPGEVAGPEPLRWWALAVLSLAQFMLVLNATVVNVALPSIERDLGMGPAALAWVVNGYALTFGGLLLLGGRLADLFGRRRAFLGGLGVFASASVAGGLSAGDAGGGPSPAGRGRGPSGAGGPLHSDLALYRGERARQGALGLGGLAGLGATAGVLPGGVLTEVASWRWIFLVNVPVAAVALLLVPRLVGESRSLAGAHGRPGGRLDVPGALLITAGLSSVVFALLGKGDGPWTSTWVVVPLFGGFAMIGLFAAVEVRAENPLVPLRFFRSRIRSTANVVFALVSGALVATYFSLSLYMQQILGYSPLWAGLAYLPLCAAFFVGISAASRLIPRFGARPVMSSGLWPSSRRVTRSLLGKRRVVRRKQTRSQIWRHGVAAGPGRNG